MPTSEPAGMPRATCWNTAVPDGSQTLAYLALAESKLAYRQ